MGSPLHVVPATWEPARISWRLGLSPRPLTTSPFSVRDVCLPRLFLSPCRSATFSATRTPLALYQGPLPMRSRALTAVWVPEAVVLRYACQVRLPAPTAAAKL